jgi:hypothetical protein
MTPRIYQPAVPLIASCCDSLRRGSEPKFHDFNIESMGDMFKRYSKQLKKYQIF